MHTVSYNTFDYVEMKKEEQKMLYRRSKKYISMSINRIMCASISASQIFD